MPGPAHVDAHADADERGRPPYPPALWERLRALRLLGPGVRVLELGAGTGQATGPMQRVPRMVARRGPRPPRPAPGELDDADRAELLRGGGLFRVVHRDRFRWVVDLDAGQVRALFTTFSDWTPDEAEEGARAATDLGGTVREHDVTPLLVLRRLA
jgi:hypothetical protein